MLELRSTEIKYWSMIGIRPTFRATYAIGDVVPGPALAHVASAEGITCVEKIAGLHVEPLTTEIFPGVPMLLPKLPVLV